LHNLKYLSGADWAVLAIVTIIVLTVAGIALHHAAKPSKHK